MASTSSPPPSFSSSTLPHSSSQSSFLIVPAAPASSSTPKQSRPRPSPSFAIPASTAKPPSPVKPHPQVVDASQLVSYRAPAHKHAHHLHSIPPREKTVKTLILDHMLWQHTRARFLQARLELGLPRRPSSHPQSQSQSQSSAPGTSSDALGEFDEECGAEKSRHSHSLSPLEQDILTLKFGVYGPDRAKAYYAHADNRFVELIDLETARVQRDTAQGIEKVSLFPYFPFYFLYSYFRILAFLLSAFIPGWAPWPHEPLVEERTRPRSHPILTPQTVLGRQLPFGRHSPPLLGYLRLSLSFLFKLQQGAYPAHLPWRPRPRRTLRTRQ